MRGAGAVLLALLASGAAAAPDGDGPHRFTGSWSASGTRHALPVEGEVPAAVLTLSGSVVLDSGDGLGRGFRGEAVGYDDGRGLRVGRSVWTDERGDRIFGALTVDPLETGGRVEGAITGGTGRYAGITGRFAFTWRYVVRAEDGTFQGLASDLRGEWRRP